MTVLNDLDRFHLVMDVSHRLPQLGAKGAKLKKKMEDKLVEHKQYIDEHGQDMPEVRNWKWSSPKCMHKRSWPPRGRWSPPPMLCGPPCLKRLRGLGGARTS